MGNSKNQKNKLKKRRTMRRLAAIPLKSFIFSAGVLILTLLTFSYLYFIKDVSNDTTMRIAVIGHNFQLKMKRASQSRPATAELLFEADGKKYFVHYGQAEYLKYSTQVQQLIQTDNIELTLVIPLESFPGSTSIEVYDLRSENKVYYDISDALYRVAEARCVVIIIGLLFATIYFVHAFLVLGAYGVIELKGKKQQ